MLGGPTGFNQESYDAECAAITRAPETAARRRVMIFTDAQAAIRRMASEGPGPARRMQFRP